MSSKEPSTLADVLTQVLREVSQSTGSIAALEPVWYRVVGAHISQHTKLIAITNRRLRVRCDSEAMRLAVDSQRPRVERELINHLGAALVGVDLEC